MTANEGYQNVVAVDYEHQAYVDRIVAKAPPATEEDIDWLRNTIRAGREQAARTTKAS